MIESGSKPPSCPCQAKQSDLESDALSRRALLGVAAFAAAAAAVLPLRASAQQKKVSQQEAQYQASAKNGQQCSTCSHFQAPSSCELVDGSISASGWCALYMKKS